GYMLPPMLVATSLLGIYIHLRIDDTLFGLALAHIVLSLPFGAWMLVTFFRTIPFELEEAAWIDGASRLQALRHIILPLAVPGAVAVAVFTFILSFTDYVFGLMLVSSDENKTVPVGLAAIQNS